MDLIQHCFCLIMCVLTKCNENYLIFVQLYTPMFNYSCDWNQVSIFTVDYLSQLTDVSRVNERHNQ